MMRVRQPSTDSFAPISVPAICLGPSEVVPGAYVMLKEGHMDMEVTGNIQVVGKSKNLREDLFQMLVGPPDELKKFEEKKEPELDPLLPKRWTCPACRGQHRPHNRLPGSCKLQPMPDNWVVDFQENSKEEQEEEVVSARVARYEPFLGGAVVRKAKLDAVVCKAKLDKGEEMI